MSANNRVLPVECHRSSFNLRKIRSLITKSEVIDNESEGVEILDSTLDYLEWRYFKQVSKVRKVLLPNGKYTQFTEIGLISFRILIRKSGNTIFVFDPPAGNKILFGVLAQFFPECSLSVKSIDVNSTLKKMANTILPALMYLETDFFEVGSKISKKFALRGDLNFESFLNEYPLLDLNLLRSIKVGYLGDLGENVIVEVKRTGSLVFSEYISTKDLFTLYQSLVFKE